MGLTHKHVRRDLLPNKMAAVSYLTDATYEFSIGASTKARNKWEEYMVRIINAETTIQLHRVINETSGWLDMLDDWQTNQLKLTNDA